MSHTSAVVLISAGIPACLLRIWWIWWSSPCRGCGRQHSACTCATNEPGL